MEAGGTQRSHWMGASRGRKQSSRACLDRSAATNRERKVIDAIGLGYQQPSPMASITFPSRLLYTCKSQFSLRSIGRNGQAQMGAGTLDGEVDAFGEARYGLPAERLLCMGGI